MPPADAAASAESASPAATGPQQPGAVGSSAGWRSLPVNNGSDCCPCLGCNRVEMVGHSLWYLPCSAQTHILSTAGQRARSGTRVGKVYTHLETALGACRCLVPLRCVTPQICGCGRAWKMQVESALRYECRASIRNAQGEVHCI